MLSYCIDWLNQYMGETSLNNHKLWLFLDNRLRAAYADNAAQNN